jgi:hypothetical protein
MSYTNFKKKIQFQILKQGQKAEFLIIGSSEGGFRSRDERKRAEKM